MGFVLNSNAKASLAGERCSLKNTNYPLGNNNQFQKIIGSLSQGLEFILARELALFGVFTDCFFVERKELNNSVPSK